MNNSDYEVLTDFLLEQGLEDVRDLIAKANALKEIQIFVPINERENILVFRDKSCFVILNKGRHMVCFALRGPYGSFTLLTSLKPRTMINDCKVSIQKLKGNKK